ncbi:RNA-processing protein [Candidatus Woesearchaeota archaeon]|nr:RNA-processing protein [Candidatus Woesearchaeota archaeon]
MASSVDEYAYELKIPKERVAVLIGKEGSVKKQIEQSTCVTLDIDSNEGEVKLIGNDALGLYSCREIVRAISRGFNPEIALLLLKQDYGFEMINIADFAGTKNDAVRLKGRVIGEGGKSRKVIEELTDCHVSVYGKTVSLVGGLEWLPSARRAVESLLSGSPHSSVYHWLEKRRKDLRRRELQGGGW